MKKQSLNEMVTRVMRQVLAEAFNNLTLREFTSDMHRLGFTYRKGAGSSRIYYIPEFGDCSAVTIHAHGDNALLDGNSLRMVRNVLFKIGWFDDPENFKSFPFEKWKISKDSVRVSSTQQEIKAANEQYKDADVIPVFPMKNSICALVVDDQTVNLCRGPEDRRPLLSDWFNKYGYDRKTNSIPCLKRDNWDEVKTEVFPINQDGTLDMKNVMFENKKYGQRIN